MSDFSQSLALIIGINQYHNGIPPLRTAANDAKVLSDILESSHNYEVVRLLDEAASLETIQTILGKELLKNLRKDDRFIFYFAGHGIALNGEDGPAGYLIPQNAKLGNIESYLPMSQLHQLLNELPCRHFLAILDCCFSGAFRWSSTRDLLTTPEVIHKERYDRFIESPAWQVITSAAYDQKALDFLTLADQRGAIGEHSPFAIALIEALQGSADSSPPAQPGKPPGDGVITATELYLYLRDRVEPATENLRFRQTPGIWALNKHEKGEYIFLTPGHELNLPPAPPLDESQNPYRGLESFDEAHSHLFFGRKALIETLYPFVSAQPLTVILGVSGTGKSSLIKAGLIPYLRTLATQISWHILEPLRPGASPFVALNKTLEQLKLPLFTQPQTPSEQEFNRLLQCLAIWVEQNPNSHLLLVIDQSEELMTLCQNEQERTQFLQLLDRAIATYPQHLRVILTLRSDFEPQLRQTALEPYWNSARFVIPPMTREELRQAIEEPASARVMYFEPASLVDRLLDEVMQMPGALPLLSFTLSELYLKCLDTLRTGERDRRAITLEDYEDLGGVTRALTQRADAEYEKLVQKNKGCSRIICHLMLRMVAISGSELARRRVSLSELEYSEPKNTWVQHIIQQFSAARLLVGGIDAIGDRYIEPAHDALIRGWQRLLNWQQQEQEAIILQRRLTPAAIEWKVQQQSQFLWYADPRLDLLRQTLNSNDDWLNQTEAEFVRRSIEKRRKNRMIFSSFVGLAFLSLLSFTTAIGYLLFRTNLENRAAAAQELLKIRPVDAMVKNITTIGDNLTWMPWHIFNSVEWSLIETIQRVRESDRFIGHTDYVTSVTVSRDGNIIVSGSEDGTIRLWNQQGNPINQPFQGHTNGVTSVAISPNGQLIVSGSHDKTLRLWNLQGQPINQPFQGHTDAVVSVTFSPNGQIVASGSRDGTIRLWNLRGNPIAQPLRGHTDAVTSIAFSPNGQRIASSSRDRTLRLWDLNGTPIGQPFQGHEEAITAVAFHPQGNIIASSSYDRTIRLWNLQAQPIGQPFRGHEDFIRSIAFSPDGQRMVSGGDDQTLRLWTLNGKQIGQPFLGHGDYITAVTFSPDGQTLISASDDRTVRLWDIKNNPVSEVFEGHEAYVTAIALSPNGQILASSSYDKTLRLWNTQGNPMGKPFRGHNSIIWSVAFHPNGNQMVSADDAGMVYLWNLNGQAIARFRAHQQTIWTVAFSPNGQQIVTGSDDGTIRLWDLQGQPIGKPFVGHQAGVSTVTFSPNSQIIASGSLDRTVRLWDLQGNSMGKPFAGHQNYINTVAFSPDGRIIASGGWDNTIRLWDLNGKPIGKPFRGHDDYVSSIAFSPLNLSQALLGEFGVGQTLISGSRDGSVRLWNLNGEELVPAFREHANLVSSVAFSPNSKTIFSSSRNGTIRSWQVKSWQVWLGIACNQLREHPVLQHPQTTLEKQAKHICRQS